MRDVPQRLGGILNEIVSKYHSEWFGIFQAGTPPRLTLEQRFALQQACGDELCTTGLGEDDEPNDRGYLLEELIDWLGHE